MFIYSVVPVKPKYSSFLSLDVRKQTKILSVTSKNKSYKSKDTHRFVSFNLKIAGIKSNGTQTRRQRTTRPPWKWRKDSYLTVNIAVVGLLTFATLKKVFSPVMKTQKRSSIKAEISAPMSLGLNSIYMHEITSCTSLADVFHLTYVELNVTFCTDMTCPTVFRYKVYLLY